MRNLDGYFQNFRKHFGLIFHDFEVRKWKNRYEEIAEKLSEKRRLLFRTSGAEKCHGRQEGTSRGGVLGSEGRTPPYMWGGPLPLPNGSRFGRTGHTGFPRLSRLYF